MDVPSHRSALPALLAENPNYFGNLPDSDLKPVMPLQADTSWEEVIGVGYNADRQELEATFAIKLPFGYGGNLCTPGSWEYVRFWVNTGSGWQDAGLAGVNVHDPAGRHRLHRSGAAAGVLRRQPSKIMGHVYAVDPEGYPGSYSIWVEPQNLPGGVGTLTPVSPVSGETGSEPGDKWTLDTTNMSPCAYTVQVQAVNRVIADSVTVGFYSPIAAVGFALGV